MDWPFTFVIWACVWPRTSASKEMTPPEPRGSRITEFRSKRRAVRIPVYAESDINRSCRIGSANDGKERILTLPIRHNRERQSDAKKAKSSSQGLNRATLVSGGASLLSAFSFIARSACEA